MSVLHLAGDRLPLGSGHPVVVVAELSGNHNGDLGTALLLIREAKMVGADAIKLQTYTADTITMDAPGPWFAITEGPWAGRRLHDLYAEASTPWAWHREIFAEAARLDMPCFSSPFDPTAVDFLEDLRCPCYKVASFEVVDIPLLRRVAVTRKPVVMSTGMASAAEIGLAVRTLREGGCPGLALLNCVSAYPAAAADMHLGNIPRLAAAFGCEAGLSDHTRDDTAAIAAVALGARLIEKHLCLDRSAGGPDAGFSLEPAEFARLVGVVRAAEQAVRPSAAFGPGQADAGNLVFRKSLFAARDIDAGKTLTEQDIRCIRPGHGLPPADLPKVIGRTARDTIVRGVPLTWDLFT
jgi:N-acetylneuraminate synthase